MAPSITSLLGYWGDIWWQLEIKEGRISHKMGPPDPKNLL
jgi:hypothetical protein